MVSGETLDSYPIGQISTRAQLMGSTEDTTFRCCSARGNNIYIIKTRADDEGRGPSLGGSPIHNYPVEQNTKSRLIVKFTPHINPTPQQQLLMASLIAIPNELLDGILSRLKIPDLSKICLVCHHLRAVAEPFLYRTVVVDTEFRSTTHSLLLSLLNRPMLANFVHELSLLWIHLSNIPQYLPRHPEGPMELARFNAAALSVGLADDLPSHGSHVMLLLHFLPCLRVLDIRFRYQYSQLRHLLEEQAILPRPSLPIGLQSLRQFSCSYMNHSSACSPLMVLGLLALPSIRTLDICMFSEIEISIAGGDADDGAKLDLSSPDFVGTSSVTDLRFGSSVSSSSLMRIIPIARRLTRFSFGERGAGRRNGFKVAELRTALQGLRETLQRLAVCFEYYHYTRGDRDATLDTIGSLRDWPVLAEIRCPVSLLLGVGGRQTGMVLRLVELVPRVVREVRITAEEYWSDEEIAEQVGEMVKLKNVYGLQRLALVSFPHDGRVEEMRSVCDAASVRLVVISKYARV